MILKNTINNSGLFSISGIPVMYCLLEVVSVYPEKLAPKFVDKIDWIKVFHFYVIICNGDVSFI